MLKDNLVDEQYELPSYVRTKFYNGFPGDWDIVHQLWRDFVVQGCKPIFQWPNPSRNNDNSLFNELTEMTVPGHSSTPDNKGMKLVDNTKLSRNKRVLQQHLQDANTSEEKYKGSERLIGLNDSKSDSSVDGIGSSESNDILEESIYGTANNPKILTSWIPKVLQHPYYGTEYGLIFEGNLLNEAGYVVKTKFATGLLLRRVSIKLIETVDREYFQLIGQIHDLNNVVPKHLLKYCRNGCPGKVYNFCRMWKEELDNDQNLRKESQAKPSNDANVSISRSARRKLPLLSYWAGERVVVKDNKLVYICGNLNVSTLSPQKNTSTKALNTSNVRERNPYSTTATKERKSQSNDRRKSNRPNSAPESTVRTKKNGRIANKKSTNRQASLYLGNVETLSEKQNTNINSRKRVVTHIQFNSSGSDAEKEGMQIKTSHQHSLKDIDELIKGIAVAGPARRSLNESGSKKRQRMDTDISIRVSKINAIQQEDGNESIVRTYNNGIMCTYTRSSAS